MSKINIFEDLDVSSLSSVKILPQVFATPEEAYSHGEKYVRDYNYRVLPKRLSKVLGVIRVEGEFSYLSVVKVHRDGE